MKRVVLDYLFPGTENEINNVTKKAQHARLIKNNGPALGCFQDIASERDANEAWKCSNGVHHAEN